MTIDLISSIFFHVLSLKCFIFRIILIIINTQSYCKQACIVEHMYVYLDWVYLFFHCQVGTWRMVLVCLQNVPSMCSRQPWMSLRTETAAPRMTTGLELNLGNRTRESMWESGWEGAAQPEEVNRMQFMIAQHMCSINNVGFIIDILDYVKYLWFHTQTWYGRLLLATLCMRCINNGEVAWYRNIV